jgi:hypothetical protein
MGFVPLVANLVKLKTNKGKNLSTVFLVGYKNLGKSITVKTSTRSLIKFKPVYLQP